MSAFDLLSSGSWIQDNLVLFCCIVGAVAVAVILLVVLFVVRRNTKRKSEPTSVATASAESEAKIEVSPDIKTAPVEEPTIEEVSTSAEESAVEEVLAPVEEPVAEEVPVPVEEPEVAVEPVVESVPVEETVAEEVPALVEEPAVEEAPEPVEELAVEEVPAEEPKQEKVIVKQVSQPAFNFITVRYDRSFEARIIQLDDVGKEFYSQLKNELLSYPKVKSRMSWRHETFRLGRKAVAKMKCRGRTLCVYLALDPKQYAETKYLVEDVSEVKQNAQTPCLYRMKNERRCRYAKQLIADLFATLDIAKGTEQDVDYKVPYEPLDSLLERGLVKRVEVKSTVLGEVAPVATEMEDDDEIVEVIRVPVAEEEPVEEVVEEPVEEVVEAPVEEVVEEPVEEVVEEPVEEVVEEPIEEIVEEPVEEVIEEPVEEVVEEPVEEVVEEPVEEVVEEPVEEPEEEHVSVSVVEAHEAMEDEVAVAAVTESNEVSNKAKQVVVNVDTLSKYFSDGDRVTIKEMKEVIPFVPNKATYVKVLARGRINKSLEVEADDFSLDAVKMIVLAGGKVIRKRSN